MRGRAPSAIPTIYAEMVRFGKAAVLSGTRVREIKPQQVGTVLVDVQATVDGVIRTGIPATGRSRKGQAGGVGRGHVAVKVEPSTFCGNELHDFGGIVRYLTTEVKLGERKQGELVIGMDDQANPVSLVYRKGTGPEVSLVHPQHELFGPVRSETIGGWLRSRRTRGDHDDHYTCNQTQDGASHHIPRLCRYPSGIMLLLEHCV